MAADPCCWPRGQADGGGLAAGLVVPLLLRGPARIGSYAPDLATGTLPPTCLCGSSS